MSSTETNEMIGMLDELALPSLKTLAKNKEISIESCKTKQDIISRISKNIDKSPNIDEIYRSQSKEVQDFVNCLLMNEEKYNVSSIYRIISPKDYWRQDNMRTIRNLLKTLVPTGLVFFVPPPSYRTSVKEDYYKFYIPESIKEHLLLCLFKPMDFEAADSKEQPLIEELARKILLQKLEKNTPQKSAEITASIKEDLEIDEFGIKSGHRKRHIKSIEDLYGTIFAVALSKTTPAEKALYNFLSSLPDKWLDDEELLKISEKYMEKNKFNAKTKTRLVDLGIIKTKNHNGKTLIGIPKYVKERKFSVSKNAKAIYAENNKLYVDGNKIKDASLAELYTLLKYFTLKKDKESSEIEISLSKIGFALENYGNIDVIKNEMKEADILEYVENSLNEIDGKYGNFLLHKNLSVYEINDSSIIYQLNKNVQIKEISHLDKYLVIPKREKENIEKIIKNYGYVIKQK